MNETDFIRRTNSDYLEVKENQDIYLTINIMRNLGNNISIDMITLLNSGLYDIQGSVSIEVILHKSSSYCNE